MGFRCSLVAVKDLSPDRLLQVLGFEKTGQRAEFSEPGFSLVQARDGWSLLLADGADRMDYFDEDDAKRLSEKTSALYFVCETTSMNTDLSVFRAGAPWWSIHYDASEGASSPDLAGEMPDFLDKLIKERAEQNAEDEGDGVSADCMFELTFDVLFHLIGVRPDQDSNLEDPEPFEELRKLESSGSRGGSTAKAKGFFGHLFGKG